MSYYRFNAFLTANITLNKFYLCSTSKHMELTFFKYQGTGNDFVMFDNRTNTFPKEAKALVANLCDRKFGIGADGLILIEHCTEADFKMVYYNADGNEGSLCGNGGRCSVAFAKYLNIIGDTTTFLAADGVHFSRIEQELIHLQMQNVTEIKEKPNYVFLNTGSPHHIQFVEHLKELDVVKEGAKLRYGMYGEKGSNINFVQQVSETAFAVRTYERGVENETLSCGTGVTAVALAMHYLGKTTEKEINISTEGGNLLVRFEKEADGYSNIYLIGPAQLVYKGEISCRI